MANPTLLPSSAGPLPRILEQAMDRTALDIPIRDLWDPDRCPAPLLPWLAWALSVEHWDASWPEQIKRNVIKANRDILQRKGTADALKRAVHAIRGDDLKVVEWFEDPSLAPMSFRVDVNGATTGWNEALDAQLGQAIAATKNARSQLAAIDVSTFVSEANRHLVTAQTGDTVEVLPWAPIEVLVTPPVRRTVTVELGEYIEIQPWRNADA
ncbi:phage tail protein I [Desulfoluna butyratoxydans]|uniref:Tail p2 i: phage tail protein i n=1 Tax=Desulfoluna butyratoxydans TaxID=231438 RepID=A0A4U8YL85_9BACT|nr:phage tail protein I [Desulfoluna butyratoxydans]VFQ44380.1 tail p2 i: phage tail protein i [Desulfoluna butyratoxydans]